MRFHIWGDPRISPSSADGTMMCLACPLSTWCFIVFEPYSNEYALLKEEMALKELVKLA